jgi:hypothetical protein
MRSGVLGARPTQPMWRKYQTFSPFAYSLDVTMITEILVDIPSRIAIVKFESGLVPTPYFDQLKKIDREGYIRGGIPQLRDDVHSQRTRLKKFDQGWRVAD